MCIYSSRWPVQSYCVMSESRKSRDVDRIFNRWRKTLKLGRLNQLPRSSDSSFWLCCTEILSEREELWRLMEEESTTVAGKREKRSAPTYRPHPPPPPSTRGNPALIACLDVCRETSPAISTSARPLSVELTLAHPPRQQMIRLFLFRR